MSALQGFIQQLCGAAANPATAAAAGTTNAAEAHRARAARGPTSMDNLTEATQEQQEVHGQQQEQQQQQLKEALGSSSSSSSEVVSAGKAAAVTVKEGSHQGDAAAAADQAVQQLQGISLQEPQQEQQQQDGMPSQQQPDTSPQQLQGAAVTEGGSNLHPDQAAQQSAAEGAQLAAAVQALLGSVRIVLLTGDLKRGLQSKGRGCTRRFAAATVGHRHVHLLGPEGGLAEVMRPAAPVFVETGAYMVQLGKDQAVAFEQKVVELAAAAGFVRHPAFCSGVQQQQQQQQGSEAQEQQQRQQGNGQAAGRSQEGQWQLPLGHLALCVAESIS